MTVKLWNFYSRNIDSFSWNSSKITLYLGQPSGGKLTWSRGGSQLVCEFPGCLNSLHIQHARYTHMASQLAPKNEPQHISPLLVLIICCGCNSCGLLPLSPLNAQQEENCALATSFHLSSLQHSPPFCLLENSAPMSAFNISLGSARHGVSTPHS